MDLLIDHGGGSPIALRLWLLSIAAIALPRPATAQAVYGSIAGTITHAAGRPLADVTVTIVSLERRTVDSLTSNESGFYVKERLLPGLYEVQAELPRFKKAVAPRVTVSVDTQTPIDFQLELGSFSEQIEVRGGSPLLSTDRADIATRFEAAALTALPVLDRNFTKFLLLTPGAQQLPWQHAGSENPQGSTQTMVNGQHFGGTAYQLDGTDNRDPVLGIIVINPTLESIAETKITSQGYDAEFGQATSGVVSVRTRSGGNAFRASAFEFYQSDRFQARNPFTQPPDRPLPDTERHQFGGSLGGPIRRNRFFFFSDYQGTQSRVGGSRRLTVPTARARAGDLSEYDIAVFDPATGPPDRRQPFPGAVIPAERLSPQALALLGLVPLPNLPGLRDNYLASGSESFDSNAFNVRLDGRIGDRLNLFGRYSFADFDREGPAAFGRGGGQELVSLGGTSSVTNQGLALGADWTIGASYAADLRLGFFRYKVDVLQFDFGTAPAQDLGLPGLNRDRISSGLPSLFVEGPFGFAFGSGHAGGCNCPLLEDEKQFQIVGNLTKIAGNHVLKVGVDVRRALNLRVASDFNRSGELSFSESRTRGAEGGGLGLAAFLLGDVTSFRRYVSSTTDARERQWRHFYYAQDTWRASARLTLNLGLRLDVIDPQSVNGRGHGGWIDLGTGEVRVGAVGDVGLDGGVRNTLNWAPRLGATYRLGGKTVLRAGYGRSYDIGVFGSTFGHAVTQNLPVLLVQELNAPDNFERVFTLREGPPAPVFPAVPSNGHFPLPDGVFSQALPEKMRLPRVDAYNLTVQRQLGETVSVEAGYVGNKGTHVFGADLSAVDVNEPTLAGFPGRSLDERRPFFRGPVSGLGAPYGWTQRIDYFCNCGDNRYDSFQARLSKQFNRGFSMFAQYTLQRARQDGHSQFFFDRELERGRPDWDRVHNVTVTGVAALPIGRGRRYLSGISGALDRILGGWQLNWIALLQSGLPFDVTYRDAGADRDVGPDRPDLIGDPRAGSGDGQKSPYFNATPIGSPGAAFGRPAPGTFGSLRRNRLTGPGYWRVDASLFKTIVVRRKALELRIEVVNLFNHVNLDNPDAEIGVPGNDNPNAGFITSTAYLGSDPQRNVQFGARLTF